MRLKYRTPIERNGVVRTLTEWAREHGIPPLTVLNRCFLGWDLEKALTTPRPESMPACARRAA